MTTLYLLLKKVKKNEIVFEKDENYFDDYLKIVIKIFF